MYMRLFFQGALKQPFEMSPSMKDVSKIIVSFLFYLGAISEAQASGRVKVKGLDSEVLLDFDQPTQFSVNASSLRTLYSDVAMLKLATMSPTPLPTLSPTTPPSFSPSSSPTATPSSNPSSSPTPAPTPVTAAQQIQFGVVGDCTPGSVVARPSITFLQPFFPQPFLYL